MTLWHELSSAGLMVVKGYIRVRNPMMRSELKVVDDTRAERLWSPHNSAFQELIGCFRKAAILPPGVCTLLTALHMAFNTSADNSFWNTTFLLWMVCTSVNLQRILCRAVCFIRAQSWSFSVGEKLRRVRGIQDISASNWRIGSHPGQSVDRFCVSV
jgi:hypothetical protein